MTKDDFIAWKKDPITVAWFQAAFKRIEEGKEILAETAGLNPLEDSYMRGMLRAFNELLATTFEEVNE